MHSWFISFYEWLLGFSDSHVVDMSAEIVSSNPEVINQDENCGEFTKFSKKCT